MTLAQKFQELEAQVARLTGELSAARADLAAAAERHDAAMAAAEAEAQGRMDAALAERDSAHAAAMEAQAQAHAAALAEAQAQAEEAGRLAAAHARKLADPAYADASIAGQAPVEQDAAAEAGGSLWEQYAAIKDPAERSRFYAEHEKEMDF